MDSAPEEIQLAVEIIRQLENLDYSEQIILQAMTLVCKDTLNKMPEQEQEKWQTYLQQELISPGTDS